MEKKLYSSSVLYKSFTKPRSQRNGLALKDEPQTRCREETPDNDTKPSERI